MEIGQIYISPTHYITCYPSQEWSIKSGADTYGILQYADLHLAAAIDTRRRFFDRHGIRINYIEPKSLFLTVARGEQKYRHDFYEFWQILIAEQTHWIVWHNSPNYDYIVPAKLKL